MHVRVSAVLLLLLYAAALGVAVADLPSRAVAGGVVLAGLLVRWGTRAHRTAPRATPAPEAPLVTG